MRKIRFRSCALAALIIAVAVVAAGLWLNRLKREAQPHASVARVIQFPAMTRPVLVHKVKMATVVGFASRPPSVNPVRHDWSDVELIIDDKEDFEDRLAAIRRLPLKLTPADWDVLKKFLIVPEAFDSGQVEQVVKNGLMDKLCTMEPPPKDLGNTLADIFQNLLQNEVLRDYAVQHLATLDQAIAENGRPGASQEEKTDQEVLWNALAETGDSIAGTALLGLMRLSNEPNAQVDRNRISAAALQMARDNTAGELAQITAYQVCAQLNLQDALPTIESAAQNGPTISAQISATGALGILGGAADVPLLQNLLQSNQERLRLPSQVALNRIQKRLH